MSCDDLQDRLDAININVLDYCNGYDNWIGAVDVGTIIQDAVDDAVLMLTAGTCRSATIGFPPAPVALPWTTAVLIDDPRISISGSGSQTTRFNCAGAVAHLTVRTNIAKFNGNFNNKVGGMTLVGDATASNKGFVTGDVIGSELFDFTVRNFTGADAIGIHVENVNYWYERNRWLGVYADHCTTGIQFTGTTPGTTQSFGYNNFLGIVANADAGQTALRLTSNTDFYSSHINMICNISDAGTVVSLEGGAHFRDTWGAISAEQTTGTGGRGWVLANGTYVRHFGPSLMSGLPNDISASTGRSPPFQIVNGTALSGSAPQQGGQGTFSFNGVAATPYPLAMTKPEDNYAEHGVLTGTNIESPYVSMYNAVGNGFGIFVRSFGANVNDLNKVGEITHDGDFDARRAHTTPGADGGNYYTKPTILASDTYNLPYRVQGGLIVLRDGATGGVGVFRVDEAMGVFLISGNAQFVAGMAGSDQIGLAASASSTTISNGFGASRLVHVAVFGAQLA